MLLDRRADPQTHRMKILIKSPSWRLQQRFQGHTEAQDEDFDLRRSQRSLSEDGQQGRHTVNLATQPRFQGHTEAQDEDFDQEPELAASTAIWRPDQSLEAAQMVDFIDFGLAGAALARVCSDLAAFTALFV